MGIGIGNTTGGVALTTPNGDMAHLELCMTRSFSTTWMTVTLGRSP